MLTYVGIGTVALLAVIYIAYAVIAFLTKEKQ